MKNRQLSCCILEGYSGAQFILKKYISRVLAPLAHGCRASSAFGRKSWALCIKHFSSPLTSLPALQGFFGLKMLRPNKQKICLVSTCISATTPHRMLPSYVSTTSLQADAFRMENNNQQRVVVLLKHLFKCPLLMCVSLLDLKAIIPNERTKYVQHKYFSM